MKSRPCGLFGDETCAKFHLGEDQIKAFNQLAYQLQQMQMGAPCSPMRLYIEGVAGTGKTCLVHAIIDFFTESECLTYLQTSAYMAHAAGLIQGTTIHHALNIRVTKYGKNQGSASFSVLQEKVARIRFFIIDEISMVGARFFSKIQTQLQSGKEDGGVELFGGVNLVFVGDFLQLPPVADAALYSELPERPKTCDVTEGLVPWSQLAHSVKLNQ